MRLRFLGAIVLASIISATVMLPVTASTKSTPFARMKEVVANGESERSVRWTGSYTTSTSHVEVITDAGRDVGRQTFIFATDSQQSTAVVLYVGNTMYCEGDALVLNVYFAMSKSTATQYAKRWFIVPKSNPKYAAWFEGLTIPSAIDQFAMRRSVVARPASVVVGEKVDALSGTTIRTPGDSPTGEILYYTSTGSPLPVEVTQNQVGLIASDLFSRWNEKIVVVAPKTTLQFR
jgi:hypothetical protein